MAVANPPANANATLKMVESSDADLVLCPELGITGYTCGDLFASDSLLRSAVDAVQQIAVESRELDRLIVVGLPLQVRDSLMNVAAVIGGGHVLGLVPKTFLPTYREFYEGRHFRAASNADPIVVTLAGSEVPFGTDLLFRWQDAVIGIEICEDLWTPIPPSCKAALAGANVLLNLSGSNETIGKAKWRRDLVTSQSGRCIAAYAYASAGPGESTSDLVFGGHCLVAENGSVLAESRRVGDGLEPTHVTQTAVTCDVDLQRLEHDRRVIGSLQTAGLTKRLSRLANPTTLAIGVSGGLDSTLALLVAVLACDASGRDRKCIHGVTMPGFGTTEHTRTSAERLIEATGITRECIDIRDLCLDTFRAIGHRPLGISIDDATTVDGLQQALSKTPNDAADLTFENVQARVRTMLLMSRGFVLGTGDMSEQALGWSTYNADHMSMYNVNTSIPKTLVRFLVRYAADHHFEAELRELLHRIADTPISPELLPPASDGSIRQSTEATLGAYELHDFFLFHFVRNGFSREKILYLAEHAEFDQEYSAEEIERTLDTFFRRFFANQFKRNCVPDGPKVGSVSLSPRGDWRMPSDSDSDAFRSE